MATRNIVIQIEVEELPTRTEVVNDWAKVCDRLDKGEEPVYDMTTGETRILWAWAKTHRGYAIKCKTVAPGAFRITKGAKL